MTFSRDDRPSVSIMMKNNGKMMDFDRFMYTQSKSGVRQNPIRKLSNFGQNWVPLMVQPPVQGDRGTRLTFEIDFSVHSGDMDKPSWCLTNRGELQNNLPLKRICNNPRPFLCQFPQKS